MHRVGHFWWHPYALWRPVRAASARASASVSCCIWAAIFVASSSKYASGACRMYRRVIAAVAWPMSFCSLTIGVVAWTLEVPGLKAEAYRDTRGPGVRGVRRLLRATAARRDAKGARDRAIVRLLFDLGLRRAEIVAH